MFAIVTLMPLFQAGWGTMAFSFLLAAVCLPRQHKKPKMKTITLMSGPCDGEAVELIRDELDVIVRQEMTPTGLIEHICDAQTDEYQVPITWTI